MNASRFIKEQCINLLIRVGIDGVLCEVIVSRVTRRTVKPQCGHPQTRMETDNR